MRLIYLIIVFLKKHKRLWKIFKLNEMSTSNVRYGGYISHWTFFSPYWLRVAYSFRWKSKRDWWVRLEGENINCKVFTVFSYRAKHTLCAMYTLIWFESTETCLNDTVVPFTMLTLSGTWCYMLPWLGMVSFVGHEGNLQSMKGENNSPYILEYLACLWY